MANANFFENEPIITVAQGTGTADYLDDGAGFPMSLPNQALTENIDRFMRWIDFKEIMSHWLGLKSLIEDSGQTYDATVNTQLSILKTTEMEVSAAGTLTLGYTNYDVLFDASLGGFTSAIPNGLYTGQKLTLHVNDDAIALVYIIGVGTVTNRVQDGIYVGDGTGMPMSAERTITIEWNETLGIWLVPAVLVAEYVSGVSSILQYSIGRMVQKISIARVSTSSLANHYGSTSGTSYNSGGGVSITLPISFASTPKVVGSGSDAIPDTSGEIRASATGLSTVYVVRYTPTSVAVAVTCYGTFEGKF